MRVLRWLLLGFVALVVVIAVIAALARYSDGPIGPFPGGKLSGVRASEPVADWAPLLAGVPSRLEVEVNPAHPRSVTTSYFLHDGTLYVPSMFAARKTWPKEAMANDRVVLRIGGKLYERRAILVTDPSELRPLVRSFDSGAQDAGDATALSTGTF